MLCNKNRQICRSIILQKQTERKRLALWLLEAGDEGREELNDGDHNYKLGVIR